MGDRGKLLASVQCCLTRLADSEEILWTGERGKKRSSDEWSRFWSLCNTLLDKTPFKRSLYPLSYKWRNDEFDSEAGINILEFRLTYEGPLKAASSGNRRVKEKHAIRKQLHKQLAELWHKHPALVGMMVGENLADEGQVELQNMLIRFGLVIGEIGVPEVETFARQFDRCGFRFVPLVNRTLNLICGLNILFLRRDNPGDLILPGGDIDNRIKTLLDALRIPDNCDEVDGTPDSTEMPYFFCLLENDSLITALNVTTDRLLTPPKPDQQENDVFLVIQVHLKARIVSLLNIGLIS